ncbi:MAG: twin-arginine translocation signal domain-containing protein, partial [Candidatus Aminicenantes bacterium]|nr:twin-arginine translocation signal domain-containing protein [Candidatus Aminicenantes bacterium]
MSRSRMPRREFLKTLAATAAVATAGKAEARAIAGAGTPSALDAKGLPTVVLGKTGAVVPRIGIGLGSRFCAVEEFDRALEILNAALDNGFYYWDTAYNYAFNGVVSEERIG